MTSKLNKSDVPSHIAIILDGNRRWARRRRLPEFKGHEAGADNLEVIVDEAQKLGVKSLTVWILSTENIRERAKREILGLFSLMRRGFQTNLKKMMEKGVRVTILGERRGLPDAIKMIIDKVRKTYIAQESIKLNIALNYGGKKELLTAIKDIVKKGIEVERINEELIEKHLYTNGLHDPELVIRTGGRSRLSNFMLWQTGYSELYFTKTLWPDFNGAELKRAINWYKIQKRNFGK